MKVVRYLLVAAALGGGLVSCAQAHVFIGEGVAARAYPVLPAYMPPPVYYAPPLLPVPAPPPVYPTPVVIGYYGGWHGGDGYWRR